MTDPLQEQIDRYECHLRSSAYLTIKQRDEIADLLAGFRAAVLRRRAIGTTALAAPAHSKLDAAWDAATPQQRGTWEQLDVPAAPATGDADAELWKDAPHDLDTLATQLRANEMHDRLAWAEWLFKYARRLRTTPASPALVAAADAMATALQAEQHHCICDNERWHCHYCRIDRLLVNYATAKKGLPS